VQDAPSESRSLRQILGTGLGGVRTREINIMGSTDRQETDLHRARCRMHRVNPALSASFLWRSRWFSRDDSLQIPPGPEGSNGSE